VVIFSSSFSTGKLRRISTAEFGNHEDPSDGDKHLLPINLMQRRPRIVQEEFELGTDVATNEEESDEIRYRLRRIRKKETTEDEEEDQKLHRAQRPLEEQYPLLGRRIRT